MLTCGTAIDIFAHKLCEARSPEFSSDKLVGLGITGVTGSLMVMATDKDRAVEGGIWGDTDAILVCQNSVDKLPVRKM